ncbi:hypothetical protein QTO34_004447 [Cnephaeus nilssonii]|uniref:Uncharacterized protein n=1 Tax=Cnephaeus nilssonii TaxID=3371016 RepID=A0AA40LIJ2_CNENI|nr:hypothetical protein QTO34_004447 [Eptesicus nilssonii]
MITHLFMAWFTEYFKPTVKTSSSGKTFSQNVTVIDNVPGHPRAPVEIYNKINVVFIGSAVQPEAGLMAGERSSSSGSIFRLCGSTKEHQAEWSIHAVAKGSGLGPGQRPWAQPHPASLLWILGADPLVVACDPCRLPAGAQGRAPRHPNVPATVSWWAWLVGVAKHAVVLPGACTCCWCQPCSHLLQVLELPLAPAASAWHRSRSFDTISGCKRWLPAPITPDSFSTSPYSCGAIGAAATAHTHSWRQP